MTTAILSSPKTQPSQPMKPHRWTIAEYRELDKTGVFSDVKTILLDGEIFVMPMPSLLHDITLSCAEEFLRRAFPSGVYIRNQMAFDIGTKNDPGPDLAVVPGAIRDYSKNAPTAAVMIVEVAVTSLVSDTTTKAELYAVAGVPDYWVLDATNRQLHIYRDPVAQPAGRGANAYRSRQSFGPDDTVSPLAMPTVSVKVADLLP